MGSWIPGFLDSWIPGFLDSWIPGFLDSWIPGFLDSWIPDYSNVTRPPEIALHKVTATYFETRSLPRSLAALPSISQIPCHSSSFFLLPSSFLWLLGELKSFE